MLETGLLVVVLAAASQNDVCACLPKDVACDEVASVAPRPGGGKATTLTVRQTLEAVSARCRRGALVDPAGKPIRLYRLAGCWGNPPEDYQEILQRQAAELAELRKRFRVIELTCNPAGLSIS